MADTVAGSKLYIGTTAEIDFTSDSTAIADFEADTYVEIKKISNIGEFGRSANIVQFPLIAEEFVEKSKGTRNAGDPAIVCARSSSDPGQVAVRLAERTKFFYNFKLSLPDAINEMYTDTVVYFRALVGGIPNQLGGVEDFITETYTLAIYPGPVFVESALISPAP
jgi:hypothetical protein